MGFLIILVIFLVWQLLKYRDDFAGKGLELAVYGELISYIAISLVPRTLPLAVMVASLFTYGNLGQHNELVAIKSSGVSLARLLLPLFFLVSSISVGSYFYQNEVMTWSNLKMYRLLWDIRQKDAAFSLTEGVFYNGLDGYRIKVQKKNPETGVLYDLMIYDHSAGIGNQEVILADSGKMRVNDAETMMILDLHSGARFAEHYPDGVNKGQKFSKSYFDKSVMNFDLTGLQMKNTPEELFRSNRFMLDADQLAYVVDSLYTENSEQRATFDSVADGHLSYLLNMKGRDGDKEFSERVLGDVQQLQSLKTSYAIANSLRYKTERLATTLKSRKGDRARVHMELIHRFTEALACLLLFLIGAPIGAVIKRGGIGIPAGLTIGFFILYYVLTITFEKYARAGTIGSELGGTGAVLILLPIGIYFVYKAYMDARMFEMNPKLNPLYWWKARLKNRVEVKYKDVIPEMKLEAVANAALPFEERQTLMDGIMRVSGIEVRETSLYKGFYRDLLKYEMIVLDKLAYAGIVFPCLSIVVVSLAPANWLFGLLIVIITLVVIIIVGLYQRLFALANKLKVDLKAESNMYLWIGFVALGGMSLAMGVYWLRIRSKFRAKIEEYDF